MAGPYAAKLLLSNGQTVGVSIRASEAVGAYALVDITSPAGTGSPSDFKVASPCSVVDWQITAAGTTAASGMYEFIRKDPSRMEENNGVVHS